MEIRRIFSRNTCIILFAIAVINVLLYYMEFKPYIKQEEYYGGMVNHYEAYKGSDKAVTSTIRAFYAENSDDVKNNKTAYALARGELEQRIDYAEKYQTKIRQKIGYAESVLTFNLFSDISVYEKKNLHKNISDLNTLKNIEIEVDTSRAFDSLFMYDTAGYMLLLMVMVTVYRFIKEKKNGVAELVFAASNGRIRLSLIRCAILLISSLAYSAVVYGTALCMGAAMFGGFGNLKNPLQCSIDFEVLNYVGSRLEFLVYFVIMSGIMAFVIGMIFWAVINLFTSYHIGIAVFFMGMAAETVIYYVVSENSIVKFLHYINLYYLVNCKDALCRYENWGSSAFILSGRQTFCIIAAIGTVSAFAIILLCCTKIYPVRSVSKFEMLVEKLALLKRRVVEKLPHFLKELYKSLILEKGIIFLAVIFALAFNNRLSVRYTQESETNEISQFYDAANGMTLGDELDNLIEGYEDMYAKAKDSKYGKPYESMYKNIIEVADMQKNYLVRLNERGIEGKVIKQEPYEAAFGRQIQSNQQLYALFAMLGVIMTCFGIESYEKYCGMNGLTGAAFGRRKNKLYKAVIVLLYAVIIGIVIYGLNWYDVIHRYGLENLEAPIQSVFSMEEFGLNISTGQYFALVGIYRIMILSALAMLVYYISCRFNYYGSLGISMMLVIPQILVLCGIDIVKYVSVGTLLSQTRCF